MKIRNDWMSDNDYFGQEYPNNILLNDAIRRFETQKESLEGRDATIDGIPERIVVQNHTNMLNQARYDKKMLCDMSSLVHTGSIVKFENKTWMVVSKIFDNQAYKITSVLECDNVLNLYIDGVLNEIPFTVEKSVQLYRLGEVANRFLSEPGSIIVAYVSNNSITANIKRDDIYKLSSIDNYRVIDIDRVILPGLLVLKLEFSQVSQTTPEATSIIIGDIEIKSGQTKTYYIDDTAQYTFTVLGDAPLSAYTLTVLSDTSVSITANSSTYYITLRATDNSSDEFVEKEIKLSSLF